MVIVFIGVLGLCLGSFVNALVWRLRQRELVSEGKGSKKLAKQLFKARSRSICPNCYHVLAVSDLMPVISYLALKGKCRYCHKPISWQYPLVELLTASLFVFSYAFWPYSFTGIGAVVFGLWLLILTGLVALTVYDIKWMILPDEIIAVLSVIALAIFLINISGSINPLKDVWALAGAILIGGGLFMAIFQLSGGKWIGGGDVKLGALIGLIVLSPAKAMLVIFLASLGGSVLALALMAIGRFNRKQVIPFGPFLIAATIITVLFGASILSWYTSTFLTV